jgi:hypothetical protein
MGDLIRCCNCANKHPIKGAPTLGIKSRHTNNLGAKPLCTQYNPSKRRECALVLGESNTHFLKEEFKTNIVTPPQA